MAKGDAHETALWPYMAYTHGYNEGRAAGLEEAAAHCDMRSRSGGTYAVEQAANEEARECAAAIRALKVKP